MRIAFVDVSANKLDAYEACTQMCGERVAGVSLSRFTAPDLLKVPVCAKRGFDEGADAALIFITAGSGDSHSLDLVHEKIIDVEIATSKFVFLAVVFDDEWRSQEQLVQVTEQRLAHVLETLFNSVHAPSEIAPSPPAEGAMSMFGAPTQESEVPGEASTGGSSLF